MGKEIIYTERAPEPGPYSQAVRWGDLVFVAGQTSDDPETNQPVHDDVAAQTARILDNIGTILAAAGTSLEQVVRADVYLSSLEHKPTVDEVFRRYFPKAPPARNCVAVSGIDAGLDVEIEVIAGVG